MYMYIDHIEFFHHTNQLVRTNQPDLIYSFIKSTLNKLPIQLKRNRKVLSLVILPLNGPIL